MSFSEKAEKSVRTSVWLLYILIVFEILYMISPFAFYYYSYYAIPLNWFQQSPVTSWLTIYIFPHFTDTGSLLVKGVLMLAWPFKGIEPWKIIKEQDTLPINLYRGEDLQ